MKKMIAFTRVGNYGQVVDGFYLEGADPNLTPENFVLRNHFRRFRGKTLSDGVTAVLPYEQGIKIKVDPFLYNAGFEVECNAGGFSFKKEDITEVKTKIADDFAPYYDDGVRYRLYTPKGDGPRPLVLFLHGGGESGDDNWTQLVGTYGPTAWAERFPECYVLAPQAPMEGFYIPLDESYVPVEGDEFGNLAPRNYYNFKFPGDYAEIGWGRTLLAKICNIIRRMIAEGKVDENRVYVTGMSMGGAGTIRAINVGKGLFAAAVPICPFISDEIANELAFAGKKIKIWVTSSYLDNLFDRSKYIIDGVLKLMDDGNENAFLTMFSQKEIEKYGFGTEPGTTLAERLGLNHNAAWTLTYNNEHGIMDWLMSQSKDEA